MIQKLIRLWPRDRRHQDTAYHWLQVTVCRVHSSSSYPLHTHVCTHTHTAPMHTLHTVHTCMYTAPMDTRVRTHFSSLRLRMTNIFNQCPKYLYICINKLNFSWLKDCYHGLPCLSWRWECWEHVSESTGKQQCGWTQRQGRERADAQGGVLKNLHSDVG